MDTKKEFSRTSGMFDLKTKISFKLSFWFIFISLSVVVVLAVLLYYYQLYYYWPSFEISFHPKQQSTSIALIGEDKGIGVSLNLPGYASEDIKNVKKLPSGHELRIVSPLVVATQQVILVSDKAGEETHLPIKSIRSPYSFVVELPYLTPSGIYVLSVNINDIHQKFRLNILGPETEREDFKVFAAGVMPDDLALTKRRSKICDNCFWEMALAGSPGNPGRLFQIGGLYGGGKRIYSSSDGGQTWSNRSITLYADPKLAVFSDSTPVLSGLTQTYDYLLNAVKIGGGRFGKGEYMALILSLFGSQPILLL